MQRESRLCKFALNSLHADITYMKSTETATLRDLFVHLSHFITYQQLRPSLYEQYR